MKSKGSLPRRSNRARWLTQAFWAAILALGFVVATSVPAQALPSNVKCGFAVFIGVRGTDAPAGTGLGAGNRTWNSGGMGEISGLEASMLGDPNMTFWTESLNYPATGGFSYDSSVAAGVTALRAEIETIAAQCLYTNILVAGHSQGANVILNTLAPRDGSVGLSARAKTMLTAVVIFGDPTYVSGMPYNAPGSASGPSLFNRNAISTDVLETYTRWGWAQGTGTTGPSWVPTIRSWCHAGDAFCQQGIGPDAMTIHNSYDETVGIDAALWMKHFMINFN